MNGKYHSSLYTAGWHVTTRHLSRGPQADKLVRGEHQATMGIAGLWEVLEPATENNIQTFGFEWRMTPGEAAVELACLNRISVINLHNDADNYLSGATLWISAIQPKQLTLWQLVTSHQKFRG
ncbi:hypothetical protein EDD17DRAFT_1511021 [Pisolithus thermaeus]|nr:hypothetical protein EDD17DRAFT_1511021 [Pisolithus thermaeus]